MARGNIERYWPCNERFGRLSAYDVVSLDERAVLDTHLDKACCALRKDMDLSELLSESDVCIFLGRMVIEHITRRRRVIDPLHTPRRLTFAHYLCEIRGTLRFAQTTSTCSYSLPLRINAQSQGRFRAKTAVGEAKNQGSLWHR